MALNKLRYLYYFYAIGTRTISGTPPTDYAYNITVKASDAYGGSASDTYLLVLGNGKNNVLYTNRNSK